MGQRAFRIALASIVLAAASVGAESARADGLPVLGIDVGPEGVVAPASGRYVTIPAGRNSVVARVDPDSGRILGSRLLPGSFTIPAVAYDGSASGLSADGRTLVLIRPRLTFPRARTELVVLDTPRLRPRKSVRLRGDFTFDAVSPRGGLLYLIQYVSPDDPTKYLVRAYDLRAGRLLARPIVDPNEPGEDMRGSPLTRATSPDGRWAYTLYDGAGKTPFIHALDTTRITARCIDLDDVAPGTDLSQLRLHVGADGNTLTVGNRLEAVAVVDTRTFKVGAPAGSRAVRSTQGRNWTSVAVGIGAVIAAAGALSLALRRRRRRLTLTPSATG